MVLQYHHLYRPEDFVVGTGKVHSVADLCKEAFSFVGLDWKKFVFVDKRLVRPTETGPLVANPAYIKKKLGWKPEVSFSNLVKMLVDANLGRLR